MFSEKDFEKLWFLYKIEGEPKGVSINSFCISNNIPDTELYDWFKSGTCRTRLRNGYTSSYGYSAWPPRNGLVFPVLHSGFLPAEVAPTQIIQLTQAVGQPLTGKNEQLIKEFAKS